MEIGITALRDAVETLAYVAHYDGNEWHPKSDPDKELHRVEPEFLKGYSRIREIFNVGESYDIQKEADRRELVDKIRDNIESKS